MGIGETSKTALGLIRSPPAAASAAARLRYTIIHERKLCFALRAISDPSLHAFQYLDRL